MINEVRLIGNVGQDPETKFLQGGSQVANMSVATEESWKDKSDGWQNKTSWHRISAFGFPAKYIEKYVKRGMQVYVEGSLVYGSYDHKDGHKVYTTEIRAKKVKILGKKDQNSNNNSGGGGGFDGNYAPEPNTSETGDDVPF